MILQLDFDFGKLGCLPVVTSNKNSQPATTECQEASLGLADVENRGGVVLLVLLSTSSLGLSLGFGFGP